MCDKIDILINAITSLMSNKDLNKFKNIKKNIVTIFAIFVLLIATSCTNKNEISKLSSEEIFNLIAPCTVEITAIGDTFECTGTGSFIDNNGTIVTNYHVIESCHTITITTQDDATYNVESVLGFDKERDLAIIKTNCQNKTFVNLNTNPVNTGEKIYTLGSSLGLTGTFSEGIISSASREIDGLEFIQITAPISSGNSGGPLVDEYGNVIGVTTGAFTEGQNLNLAIPVKYIDEINMDTEYSMNDFFLVSQGKVVQKSSEESLEEAEIDENYVPVDIGYFDSLEDVYEAANRNPDVFKLPVMISVRGSVARTKEDKLFLVSDGVNKRYELIMNKGNLVDYSLISSFKYLCRVNMIDDTRNRALTGDRIVIKGVYRHSAKTISDCTYELV